MPTFQCEDVCPLVRSAVDGDTTEGPGAGEFGAVPGRREQRVVEVETEPFREDAIAFAWSGSSAS